MIMFCSCCFSACVVKVVSPRVGTSEVFDLFTTLQTLAYLYFCILFQIMEWFSAEFLNLHRVYAIREEEPFLLKVFTRNHEMTNRGIRKKGGRKVMLPLTVLCGSTFICSLLVKLFFSSIWPSHWRAISISCLQPYIPSGMEILSVHYYI